MRIPRIQRHKSGKARLRIRGKDYYLGEYGSPEAKAEYKRLIGIHYLGQPAESAKLQVVESDSECKLLLAALIDTYLAHIKLEYAGQPKTIEEYGPVLKRLRAACGTLYADQLTPKAFKAFRASLVDLGHTRQHIAKQCRKVVQMYSWATEEELLDDPAIVARLREVKPLRAGKAKEQGRREPVADTVVDATLPHCPKEVRAMLELMRWTGARPSEIRIMRPADVDRSDPACWLYTPLQHKTQAKGKERIIALGPKAQAVLAPYLLRREDAWCFPSPRDSAQPRSKYGIQQCLERVLDRINRQRTEAAEKAGKEPELLPHWTPYQLRHSAGTKVRAEFENLEAVQALLGHSSARMSEHYARLSIDTAKTVAKAIG